MKTTVITCTLLVASAAYADAFDGTHDITRVFDTNISDGVTLESSSDTLAVSTSDGVSYAVELNAGGRTADWSMIRNGDLLSLTPQPTTFDGWTLCNSYMFSDGVNRAFLMMGQEAEDATDIGINVAGWTDAAGPVALSDLVGAWSMQTVENWNLRSDPHDPFLSNTRRVTISDAGNGQATVGIELTSDEGMQYLLMDFDGNIFTPAEQPDYVDLHHLAIYTDGQGLALTRIASELDDATDVCAAIGLGQPIPEPATLGLLAVGGLVLIKRRKEYRPPQLARAGHGHGQRQSVGQAKHLAQRVLLACAGRILGQRFIRRTRMKKWIAFCTVVVALLFTITANTQTAQAATIPYSTGFEEPDFSVPDGYPLSDWEMFGGSPPNDPYITNESTYVYSGDQSLKVHATSGYQRDVTLYLDNLSTTDSFTYSMAVYVPAGYTAHIGLWNLQEENNPLNGPFFSNGTIYFQENGAIELTEVDYYASGTWFELSVEIDGFTGSSPTAKVSIDGVPVADNLSAYGSSSCGSYLQLDSDFVDQGEHFYVDDVVVMPEPATLGLLAMGAAMLVARKRRKYTNR